MPARPTIFVGSSEETKGLVADLVAELEKSATVSVLPWYEAFDAGFGALEDLAKRLSEVDFAAFLLMPEDQLRVRDQTHGVPRDNVIFELGLFMGRLNRDRTFALVEQQNAGAGQVKLPSDFNGVTQVRYRREQLDELATRLTRDIERLGPLARVPIGTHVVESGAEGRNVHGTIASALEAARAGDVILVRPGVYTEALVIDKPLELIGVGVMDDSGDRAIVRSQGSTAIAYTAGRGHGRIATMSIEGAGAGMCGLDVVAGRLSVRGCTLSGRAPLEACVRVRGDGDATLYANVIQDGDGVGVLVCEHGDARITANRIVRHTHSCIEVRDRARPHIRANRISHGSAGGVWVHGDSRGEIERNEIFQHEFAGITVTDGAAPRIRGNRIYNCGGAGVFVASRGRGTIADNDIFHNAGTGIEVDDGGDPLIEHNRLYDGLGGGIALRAGGRGQIRENYVRSNQRAGIAFLANSKPGVFRGNNVADGLAEGVYDEIGASGADNYVARNALGDWLRPSATE